MRHVISMLAYGGSTMDMELEQLGGRLREVAAILYAIELAELLSEVPATAPASHLHRTGVCLLSVLGREIDAVIGNIERLTEAPPEYEVH